MKGLAVVTLYQRVTDIQTDGRMNIELLYQYRDCGHAIKTKTANSQYV